jgi:alpha-tubulin suppressor-like RCC1 family protein
MPHIGCTPSLPSPQPRCGGRVIRLTRQHGPLVAAALLVGTFGCREDATSPTAPESTRALATTAAEVLVFRQVSAAYGHTCGVTTDDRAYCWGLNDRGQLGDGTTTNHSTPVRVAGAVRFLQVSTGSFFTCGLTTDDRAYCWGVNTDGQLGEGTTTSHLTPVAVAGGRRYRDVRAGFAHVCGTTMSRRAYCWGSNSQGELGDGTRTMRLIPTPVAGGLKFRQLGDGSEFFTCGVTPGHRAYCWGLNTDGQLGDGTTESHLTPVAVGGGLRFREVNAGLGRHTCGVTTDDRAYCWGRNDRGQLGDGTASSAFRPVAVLGGLQFKSVTLGEEHTCGVTTSGLAYCWGFNNIFGTLGDGTTNQSATPVAVAGGLQFGSGTLDAGITHTCGVTTDAVAYCWGGNIWGQLGDGTTNIRLTPVPVAGTI